MYKNVTWHAGYDCGGSLPWCVDVANTATNAWLSDVWTGVNVMSWWCNKGGDSIAGIAYVGGLCSNFRTNLNEKQDTVVQSAHVCIDT